MKYVNVDSVEPGEYLGKTIYSGSGQVLLNEKVQLTVFMINTLKRIGITMIYIKDPNFNDVIIEEVITEETKREVMSRMTETFHAIRSGKEFSSKKIGVTVDSLLLEIMKNKNMLIQLTDIRTKDNDMFVHGMNVCVLASLIGANMNLPMNQMKELAIGALLHDVGKLELLCDDNAEDLKLHHTWKGFELLKSKWDYTLMIAHVAFQHHEHVDGTGIPRKIRSEHIHLFAKIVAVCNTYDNLLFERETGVRRLPHAAIELVMARSDKELSREVLLQFMQIISIYPTGTSVKLSTKEIGVVVGQHRGLPARPIIRIVKDQGGGDYDVKEIDLAKHNTIFIEQVF